MEGSLLRCLTGMPGMAVNLDNNSLVFFAADYRTDLGFHLASAASAIYKRFNPDDVKFTPGLNYVFQWFGKNELFLATHTRVAAQTLGLGVWKRDMADILEMSKTALGLLDASELNRVGFKLITFLPQSMSHEELASLFFGRFLSSEEEWSSVFENPADPLVQLNGEKSGMKLTLIASAMNQEQIVNSIVSQPNFDSYSRPRQPEASVLEFVASASNSPAVMIDLDVFKEKIPAKDLNDWVKNALTCVETVTSAFITKYLAKD
jgi:hypothetical protein